MQATCTEMAQNNLVKLTEQLAVLGNEVRSGQQSPVWRNFFLVFNWPESMGALQVLTTVGETLSQEEVDELFGEVEVDGEGRLDYTQLCQVLQ